MTLLLNILFIQVCLLFVHISEDIYKLDLTLVDAQRKNILSVDRNQKSLPLHSGLYVYILTTNTQLEPIPQILS